MTVGRVLEVPYRDPSLRLQFAPSCRWRAWVSFGRAQECMRRYFGLEALTYLAFTAAYPVVTCGPIVRTPCPAVTAQVSARFLHPVSLLHQQRK
ncbi:hypothetical protein M8818_006876 [Zalaria obscura]|uniref:Uncharacterized protein n=1 Tax=Zalaria obscura TaxID=2024903 RepID=A0ACC3S5V8_9PEZI